jgi:hypothetical protein
MKNTGKPYEELTELVFNRLLAQEKVCAKVERDVVLEGRSTKHQIDVTFHFKVGSVSYRTIVQCKDWSSTVKQEQVLAFHSVLSDIPGQPRGIMVSRSGFQEGARKIAEHHGIKLYELREPRDEDWEGLIRSIVLRLELQSSQVRSEIVAFDNAWLLEEKRKLGLDEIKAVIELDPHSKRLRFESGKPCDLASLMSKAVPSTAAEWVRVKLRFDERLIVPVPGCPIPEWFALGVDFEGRVLSTHTERTVSLDHLVAYCFRDVLEDSRQFLDADGAALGDGDDE